MRQVTGGQLNNTSPVKATQNYITTAKKENNDWSGLDSRWIPKVSARAGLVAGIRTGLAVGEEWGVLVP